MVHTMGMFDRHVLLLAAMLLVLSFSHVGARAADGEDESFKQAKRSIQTQLRSKQATDRIQAFYRLKQYHEPDAAKLVLQMGLRDTEPEVRVAAYETLCSYADDPEICKLLFSSLRKAAKAKDAGQGADVVLGVLLANEDETTTQDLLAFLDEQLATSATGPALVALTADNLGLHGQAVDLPPLQKLTTTKLFHDDFAVCRAVVQAIMRIREPATIEQLITMLGEQKGETRGDIVQYLTEITQQEHGLDVTAWKEWWEKEKTSFKYPPLARGLVRGAKAADANRPSYYGIPLFAQRLVFVFDTSGSMGGARLNAAKRELASAITKLPDDAYFGIIVFNSRVDAWQKQLVRATSDNKMSATRFISGLVAREQTNTYDALTTAFNYKAEAIYLLTDGAPTTGKIVNPPEIVVAITRGNIARRLSIYTIGIGVGPEGELFDAFLKGLAMQNYGQYRRVDK